MSGQDARPLTPDELAERWSVGVSQVYRLTREGVLPVVRVGRYYRYRVADVEEWEQKGGSGV
jgi:excisionase family DNA binding protein